MSGPPFPSLLVANRGEIAVRIMRTCRQLGVRTIAVYSDADSKALHVAEADEAYRIGPPPVVESYLKIEAILDVARQSGAAALHPGYGFLAENADFAESCIAKGVAWVGPRPEAMRALGDKAHAKALAEQHHVPLLPGYHREEQDLSTLQQEAERIGFPVLIKASAGGGGRGMRIVEAAEQFAEALEAAKREAKAAFADDRVLLERYVKRPRHVEIQILADQHGKVIHLGERECSIQRRHQKLIEESPSPAVDEQLRSEMGEAAVRLARAAGFTNAGTVEFLLDEAGQFAFLEVNARLQVEHPVTEALTGLDLVEWQLRIAAGEPLSRMQQDVKLEGHAIEVRVIAEDALAGFLPSSGTIEHFWLPPLVRTDTWITPGASVSPYYDSLMAKVIGFGGTRADATRRIVKALQEAEIEGVSNNVDLLLSTLQHPAFISGDLHTGFLDEHHIIEEVASIPDEVLAAASAYEFAQPWRIQDPWRGPAPWRLGRLDQPTAFLRAGRLHAAAVSGRLDGKGVEVSIGSRRLVVLPLERGVLVDSQYVAVFCREHKCGVEWQGRKYRLGLPKPLRIEDTLGGRGAAAGTGRLTAPMPGRIVKISVERGQHVPSNLPLVVLEAMKMEHVVEAPHAGVIKAICVELNQPVRSGEVLLELGDEAVES